MDVTQEGSVIGRTFLPKIPPICSSISGVRLHLVVMRKGDGKMVWGGSPDIRGFRQRVLLQRRLWGAQ